MAIMWHSLAYMLQTPSEHDLGRVEVLGLGDLEQDGVVESLCPCERAPGLHCGPLVNAFNFACGGERKPCRILRS